MYQIITVKTPTVYAKDAPRWVTPRPQMSLAEDAARCNAKMIGGRQQSNATSSNTVSITKAQSLLSQGMVVEEDLRACGVAW